jgi:hypothetical protein
MASPYLFRAGLHLTIENKRMNTILEDFPVSKQLLLKIPARSFCFCSPIKKGLKGKTL